MISPFVPRAHSLRVSNALLIRYKSNSESPRSVSRDEVSAVLQSSKLKVSHRDLKNIDLEIVHKKNNSYEKEIESALLPEEARKLKASNDHKSKKDSKMKKSHKIEHKPKLKQSMSNKTVQTLDNTLFQGTLELNGEFKAANPLNASTVPKLAHNLDRVLFSPGVHFLQDPRTRTYNFPQTLKKIIKLNDFNFDRLAGFVRSSQDTTLLKMAQEKNKKLFSSTSSMTGILSQFYKFLNDYDPKNTSRFNFPKFSGAVNSIPTSILLKPQGKNNNGERIYSIDTDKSADTEIILSAMGHVLEAFLTNSPSQFEKFNKNLDQSTDKDNEVEANVYNYAEYGNYLLRSQLDCFDERLPGNGTFDLKTRAVCAIRYDNANPDVEDNTYQIWKLQGKYESFQREYEDLIRTGALLKYGFQARIGQMDGIFIAYHNINTFFGFQYLPLSEIDRVFFSDENIDMAVPEKVESLFDINDGYPTQLADLQFKESLSLFELLVKRILGDMVNEGYPKDTAFRLVIKTVKPTKGKTFLKIYPTPLKPKTLNVLDEIPNSFKTSFRHDISAKEKLQELRKHYKSLLKFENELPVLKPYEIHTLYKDNEDKRLSYPQPMKNLDDLKLNYKIRRVGLEDAKDLKDIMKVRAKFIVNSFQSAYKDSLFSLDSNESATNENSGSDTEQNNNLNHNIDNNKKNTKTIMNNIDQMRIFSKIGKLRLKKWEAQELVNPPTVYKPKD